MSDHAQITVGELLERLRGMVRKQTKRDRATVVMAIDAIRELATLLHQAKTGPTTGGWDAPTPPRPPPLTITRLPAIGEDTDAPLTPPVHALEELGPPVDLDDFADAIKAIDDGRRYAYKPPARLIALDPPINAYPPDLGNVEIATRRGLDFKGIHVPFDPPIVAEGAD